MPQGALRTCRSPTVRPSRSDRQTIKMDSRLCLTQGGLRISFKILFGGTGLFQSYYCLGSD